MTTVEPGNAAAQLPAEPRANAGVLALSALCAIARPHQVPATLAHQLAIAPTDALSVDDLLRAAKHLGLEAKRSATTTARLPLTPLPALALMRNPDGSQHIVILAQCDAQRVLLQDPTKGGAPSIESLDDKSWTVADAGNHLNAFEELSE